MTTQISVSSSSVSWTRLIRASLEYETTGAFNVSCQMTMWVWPPRMTIILNSVCVSSITFGVQFHRQRTIGMNISIIEGEEGPPLSIQEKRREGNLMQGMLNGWMKDDLPAWNRGVTVVLVFMVVWISSFFLFVICLTLWLSHPSLHHHPLHRMVLLQLPMKFLVDSWKSMGTGIRRLKSPNLYADISKRMSIRKRKIEVLKGEASLKDDKDKKDWRA